MAIPIPPNVGGGAGGGRKWKERSLKRLTLETFTETFDQVNILLVLLQGPWRGLCK